MSIDPGLLSIHDRIQAETLRALPGAWFAAQLELRVHSEDDRLDLDIRIESPEGRSEEAPVSDRLYDLLLQLLEYFLEEGRELARARYRFFLERDEWQREVVIEEA